MLSAHSGKISYFMSFALSISYKVYKNPAGTFCMFIFNAELGYYSPSHLGLYQGWKPNDWEDCAAAAKDYEWVE